jgi:hypothetical protein
MAHGLKQSEGVHNIVLGNTRVRLVIVKTQSNFSRRQLSCILLNVYIGSILQRHFNYI